MSSCRICKLRQGKRKPAHHVPSCSLRCTRSSKRATLTTTRWCVPPPIGSRSSCASTRKLMVRPSTAVTSAHHRRGEHRDAAGADEWRSVLRPDDDFGGAGEAGADGGGEVERRHYAPPRFGLRRAWPRCRRQSRFGWTGRGAAACVSR
jgi:hypothetical protein